MIVSRKMILNILSFFCLINIYADKQWYEYNYAAEVLPEDATPKWKKTEPEIKSGLNIKDSIKNNLLLLEASGKDVASYYRLTWADVGGMMTKVWRPGSELGSTFEIEARAVESVKNIPFVLGVFLNGFTYKDKFYSANINIAVDKVFFMNKKSIDLRDSKQHKYRIIFDPVNKKSFSLYIDNNPEPAAEIPISDVKPEPKKNEYILFGASNSKIFQGICEISSIKWTNSGTYLPVPEDKPGAESEKNINKQTVKETMKINSKKADTSKEIKVLVNNETLEKARHIVDTWDRWPLIPVPKVKVGPKFDGTLNDKVWENASSVTGLISYENYQSTGNDSIFYFCYDDKALYVGFKIKHSQAGNMKISARGPVDYLWTDDGIEFILARDKEEKVAFVLYGNGASGYSDGCTKDNSFDTSPSFEWEYSSKITADGYQGILKIPRDAFLKEIASQAAEMTEMETGKIWRFGMMRNDMTPNKRRADLSQLWGMKYDGKRLGKLLFLPETATIKIENIGALDSQNIGISGEIKNISSSEMNFEIDYEIYKANGDLVAKRFNLMRTWDLIERFRKEGPAIEGIPLTDQISEAGHLGKLGAAYNQIDKGTVKVNAGKGDIQKFNIKYNENFGQYLFAFKVKNVQNNQILYSQTVPVNIKPPLNISLTKRFLMKNGIEVSTGFSVFSGVSEGDTIKYEIIEDASGKSLLSFRDKIENPSLDIYRFIDTNTLKSGNYNLKLYVYSEDGKEKISQNIKFKKPEKPEWFGNKIGITDKVPPPWTPVKAEGNQISVWGRKIIFNNDFPLPVQINSQGKELLASPVELIITSEGKRINLKGTTKLESSAESKAIFSSRFEADATSTSVDLKTEIEFDGLISFTMNILSGKPLDGVTLEIPIKKELVTHWGGSYWGTNLTTSKINIDAGKIEDFSKFAADGEFRFAGVFQLGNDNGVLQWICEEDKGWINSNREKAMSLISNDKSYTIKVKLVDKKADFNKGRQFKWHLMATPVKNIDDILNCKIATVKGLPPEGCGSPGKPFIPAKLEEYTKELKKNNITHFLYGGFGPPFHADIWVREHNSQYLKEVADIAHKNGLKIFIYSLWGYDINGKEYPDFGDEMIKRPLQPCFPDTYWYNPEGPFQDFYMAGLMSTLKKYDIDGVYFDGFPVTGLLYDPLLDEGYIDENGNKHGKWPFMALRNWIKRVYAVMHLLEKQDGIVYQHTSGTIPNMAILSFCDFACGGEEAPSQERLINCWPLEEYFLKCYQRPYGIGYSTLWYDWWNRPVKENQALAVTLLFGQLLDFYGGHVQKWRQNASYDKNMAPAMKLLEVYKNFQPSNAQWHPFWKSKELFKQLSPETLKSSIYLYPGGKALVVVSNLEPKPVDATIIFDLEKMGFANMKITAYDPILKQDIKMKDGKIELNILDERYRLIILSK